MTTTKSNLHAQVLVLGGGPGGYSAAFRAADLGKKVILIERYPVLGGVCLNVGCIPSKALLHLANVLNESKEVATAGISFAEPELNLDKIRNWKNKITVQLTSGLTALARQRKVTIIEGNGQFSSAKNIVVTHGDQQQSISFDHAIIAVGSQAIKIPNFPNEDPRLINSTGALSLTDIPPKLLIVGGGIIGLEMATVYAALGSKITIVEMMDQIIPGCDKDLVKPLMQQIKKQYAAILLSTKVEAIKPTNNGLQVSFIHKDSTETKTYDKVLVAVGRRPNGNLINAEKAGIQVDSHGFIQVNQQMRTNVDHIYAIGDVAGNPMLAHKATHEAKIAAEVIAEKPVAWQALTIPSVAYTDPEIAWMGKTESELKTQNIAYTKAIFPWAASGRALSIGRKEGITKLLCAKETRQILGVGMAGTNAGELIAEAVLALEMGATSEDIALTVHPHPTLSETLGFAAEMVEETITDLYLKKL